MGELFYGQFGLSQGTLVIAPLAAPAGPFQNIQPYLYWTCHAATIQSPREGESPNPTEGPYLKKRKQHSALELV